MGPSGVPPGCALLPGFSAHPDVSALLEPVLRASTSFASTTDSLLHL